MVFVRRACCCVHAGNCRATCQSQTACLSVGIGEAAVSKVWQSIAVPPLFDAYRIDSSRGISVLLRMRMRSIDRTYTSGMLQVHRQY